MQALDVMYLGAGYAVGLLTRVWRDRSVAIVTPSSAPPRATMIIRLDLFSANGLESHGSVLQNHHPSALPATLDHEGHTYRLVSQQHLTAQYREIV